MHATTDRADVIHFAGRHRLSPALRDGAPTLVPPGDVAGRCGWAELFAVVRERGLALVFEPDDATSARFVARAEAARHDEARPHVGPREEARRFLAVLRRRPGRRG